MSKVVPFLNVMTKDQMQKIHHMALAILEKSGIRVDDENARSVFEKAVGKSANENRVFIPKDMVEWAIKAAPSNIEICRRDGEKAFTLDSRDTAQTIFGIGVTNLYYQDVLTDEVTSFTSDHMAQATRLGNGLDEFDTIATPGVIQDCDPDVSEILGFAQMLANTEKPITMLISEPETFKNCLLMADQLIGEKAAQKSIIPYFNPITPLILNAETTVKMDLTISKGMPFIFSNYGMSGATCPITPGGTLALLIAELLAGLVYGQLLKEGTPVILGSLPAAFDMKKMTSYYTPQSMLINLACADMMAHYEIPHCGTSGGWMGRGPDMMAGSMLWQNHLTSVMGKAGLAPFVGNNFDSMAFSPATVVYAAEIIRMARDYSKGFSLKDEEVGLDEIIRLGPGASYLTSNLTMAKFKEPLTKSEIWPFLSLEKWQEQGNPRAGAELRRYTHDFMQTLMPPEDHDQILSAAQEYMMSMSLTH
ncbi:MAG: hypothetical protein GY729_08555 [Desulfobacteraceae bacterium]|nr:hypothetical protein [Desulfobacteraceae bacterium]